MMSLGLPRDGPPPTCEIAAPMSLRRTVWLRSQPDGAGATDLLEEPIAMQAAAEAHDWFTSRLPIAAPGCLSNEARLGG